MENKHFFDDERDDARRGFADKPVCVLQAFA